MYMVFQDKLLIAFKYICALVCLFIEPAKIVFPQRSTDFR